MRGDDFFGHDVFYFGFGDIEVVADCSFYEVAFGDDADAVLLFGDDDTADFVVFVFFCCGEYGIVFIDSDDVGVHDFFDEHTMFLQWIDFNIILYVYDCFYFMLELLDFWFFININNEKI